MNNDKLINEVNKISGITEQLETIDIKTDFITPERFGAVGRDGVDDTQSLQDAVNYAIANNKRLVSEGLKTYSISKQINIFDKLDIDFNDSTIIAISEIDNLIYVDSKGTKEHGSHKNIILDANLKANNCYYIHYSRRGKIENIKFNNAKQNALMMINSHETFTSKCNIENCGVGLNIASSDAHFTDIGMRSTRNAIKNTGGTNFYTRIHAWLDKGFKDSVFLYCSQSAILTDCYPDTYHYCYMLPDWCDLIVNGGRIFYNSTLWESDVETNGVIPIVFNFTHATDKITTTAPIAMSNMLIEGLKKSDSTYIGEFSNVAKEDLRLSLSNNKIYNISNVPNGRKATIVSENIAYLSKGVVTKKNDFCLIEFRGSLSTPLSVNTDLKIGQIGNTKFYPDSDIRSTCFFGSGSNAESLGFVTITTSGIVKINSTSAITQGKNVIFSTMYNSNLGEY